MKLPETLMERGIAAGSTAANTGLGMLLRGWNDRKQLEQQEKLNKLQEEAQQRIGRFNQGLALEMWDKTNYSAQREQMRKAGLNVGLMYGGVGAGGTTNGGQAGGIGGAQAPAGGGEIGMGMQLGLQRQAMIANIDLAKSAAEKNRADAAATSGYKAEEAGANVKNLTQLTTNAKLQNDIMGYQKEIARIESEVKKGTQENEIKMVAEAFKKLKGEAESATSQGAIDTATQQTVINQIGQNAVEQSLRISAARKGLIKADAEINQINASIDKLATEIELMYEANAQKWQGLSINEREVLVKEALQKSVQQNTDFNTSTPIVTGKQIGRAHV